MGAKGGMIAQQGLNVVGGAMNIGFARRAAKDEINANVDFNSRAQAELTRQQVQTNVSAAEARGDRVEEAERELAMLRAINAERGAGSTMAFRQIADLGRIEGKDLTRIERNRKDQVDTIQAEKEATVTNMRNASRAASNRAESQIFGALLQMGGSGVQIHSDFEYRKRMVAGARNKKDE